MTQFSWTVPGVTPNPQVSQVTDAPGLFLCPRFLLKFAATCFYLDLCTVWCLARPAFVENDRQQVIHLKIDVVGAFVVVLHFSHLVLIVHSSHDNTLPLSSPSLVIQIESNLLMPFKGSALFSNSALVGLLQTLRKRLQQ